MVINIIIALVEMHHALSYVGGTIWLSLVTVTANFGYAVIKGWN